jgi:hypothetical protein
MSRTDQLLALAKRQGVASIAKVVLEDDKYARAISEEEFVKMLTEEARAWQREGESIGQTFSRLFSADTPEALLLRKAHAAIKAANFPSVITESVSKSSDATAYDQIVAKANRLRELEPELSFDQAFARIYQDPKNIELAKRERSENRPDPGTGTNYPYPGRPQ